MSDALVDRHHVNLDDNHRRSPLLSLFFLSELPTLIDSARRLFQQVRTPRIDAIHSIRVPAETVGPPKVIERIQPFLR
jgi:hypothetical protein